MKKFFQILSAILALLFLGGLYFFSNSNLLLDAPASAKFASLPVLKQGRLMPLSSAAADILRDIGGKTSVKIDGKKVDAVTWLLFINAKPKEAADLKFFKTDNRELQTLLGASGRYYSERDLRAKYDEVLEAAQAADLSPFVLACRTAISRLLSYGLASNALAVMPPQMTSSQLFEQWKNLLEKSEKELENSVKTGKEPQRQILSESYKYYETFKGLKAREESYSDNIMRVISYESKWFTPLDCLLEPRTKGADEKFFLLSEIIDAVHLNDRNLAAQKIDKLLKKSKIPFRCKFENEFNKFQIFYAGACFYLLAFVLFLLAFVFRTKAGIFNSSAFVFLSFGLALHALGICARMYIQMRPPVTNMYSSVIFAGMISVALALFLSAKKKSKSYAFAASPLGFLSLLLALNLPYSGDTMGMMHAVLNSNFWLTTHIVPMILGYGAVLLAGFVASVKLISNAVCKGRYTQESLEETCSSVYGVLAFGLVFTFAGTMLGGVWADLSWGRFWGWDPKENGALMVLLWTALVIHAKTFKLFKDRAILALACLGNIVAAWAWFGVNIMGVGLHAYGFMDSGKIFLLLFVIFQMFVTLLAFVGQSNFAHNLEEEKEAKIKEEEEEKHKKAAQVLEAFKQQQIAELKDQTPPEAKL